MQPLTYQQTSGFSPTAVINRSQTKQVPGHEKIRDAVRAWSAVDNQDVVATLIVNEYREQGGGTIDFPDDVSRTRQKLFRFLDNKFDSEKYRNNVRELTPAILAVLPLEYRGYLVEQDSFMARLAEMEKELSEAKQAVILNAPRHQKLKEISEGIVSMFRVDPELAGPLMAMVTTMLEMAKAGLLEQNRLSGANRNTLIAGGIMANTAEIFNFPVPDAAQKEPRVADLDDGYTRIANELLEAVMLAGLTQHQLLLFLAVMRKTYGFNKKLDWVSNEQLSGLTGILPHKCSAAKSVLVKRGILIQSGRNIGINNVVSEWSTLPESGKKNKVYLKEVNLPESGKKSLPKSGKGVYPNQANTKDKLTKDNIKPFSSENSGESSDQPENDLPVVKPDAAIQSGSKWGTAEDLTAAEWMFDMVKTIAPSARKPNFAGWANDIRLMRERDGRNHRDMCVLFRWACQDNFWSGNVLSPAKLRDKWTQLEINRNKQQAGMIASKPKLDLTNTDWIYGVDL